MKFYINKKKVYLFATFASTIFLLSSILAPAFAKKNQSIDNTIEEYCGICHNKIIKKGGLDLRNFNTEHPESDIETSEKMIKQLRAGMMPPNDWFKYFDHMKMIQPDKSQLEKLTKFLERKLNTASRKRNDPGTRPFQRLNRAEYSTQIYDLLGITIDSSEWLPEDQISASFDNIADVQNISPTLMTAYLTAASDITRRAIGQKNAPAVAKIYTNKPTKSQHEWETGEGAPFGTRGGISVLHTFLSDGEYIFSMGFMSGWGERYHDIDISINGNQIALIPYGGEIDFQGRKKFPVQTDPIFIKAGEHRVVAAFIKQMDGPYEDLLRPNDWSLTGTETSYGTTSLPHLVRLTIEGPHNPKGISETIARRNIFSCKPNSASNEKICAKKIIKKLAEKAYGRRLKDDDLLPLMNFYEMGTEEGGFEAGIRTSLEAILASPYFLFRLEKEPTNIKPGMIYELDDIALAKRLSFFLWGSNPDDELINLAQKEKLSNTRNLKKQVKRMLDDPRSKSLSTRFASLWLRLQDLDNVEPDAFFFPNYSEQLMNAMKKETQLFFDHLVRENKSFFELFSADYSFMNERLAQHYSIPGIVGEEFRKVKYINNQRRGILGHGSVLVQTSLGNRTSPVLRGKWVMEVVLGTPPPPPPPGIPDLEETEHSESGRILTTRERLEMHRKNPVCASCHKVMDPIGLALDNFDVTGKWRIRESGSLLDTNTTFYNGEHISNPKDLTDKLLQKPDILIRQFTENLLTYALGRRVTPEDQPTIRNIVEKSKKDNHRISSLILGIVLSDEFRKKKATVNIETINAKMGH